MTRAEMQEQNRAKVLAAARAEFVERGFRDAKIDVIAERAALTRGAVYSNFPGKRALYFAVLAEDAGAAGAVGEYRVAGDAPAGAGDSVAESIVDGGSCSLIRSEKIVDGFGVEL